MKKIGAFIVVSLLLVVGVVAQPDESVDFIPSIDDFRDGPPEGFTPPSRDDFPDGPPSQEELEEFFSNEESFDDESENDEFLRERLENEQEDVDFAENSEITSNCLSDTVLEQKATACEERGGTVERNQRGPCEDVDCSLKQNFFSARPDCPDVRNIVKECRDLGFRAVMNKNRGCLYAKCATPDFKEGDLCAENDEKFKQSVVNKCLSDGGGPRVGFEEDTGCPRTSCSFTEADKKKSCQRDVPDSAYEHCEEQNGELIVKFDDLQCVSFQKCIKRGQEEDIEVTEEEVEKAEELDVTDLLSVTLKLEALATKLDTLGRKAQEISSYHNNVGNDGKEERYDRAALMFEAAEKRIEEIKQNIARAVEDKEVSEEEILEIKHDIKYIKEIVLNDILFVMLGEGELSEEIEEPITEQVDCEDDEECFEERLRVCGSALFNPEKEIDVVIEGLGENGCKFHAEGDSPFGALEMSCEYPDYAFGFEHPQDFIPFCEGSMVKMLEEDINRDFEDDFHDDKGMPEICIEKEVFEPRDCFELVSDKFGLPPFCKDMSSDECFEEHIAEEVGRHEPPECKEAGKSGFECGMHMMDTFGLPPQCEERGYDKKECMIAIMKNEINPEGPENMRGPPGEFRGGPDHGPNPEYEPSFCRDNGEFVGFEECKKRKLEEYGNEFGPRQGYKPTGKFEHAPGQGIDIFARCREAGIDSIDQCQSFVEQNRGEGPADRGCMGQCMQEKCDGYDCHEFVPLCEQKCGIPSFDERREHDRERENECAMMCEEQGLPWDMSRGECVCKGVHFGEPEQDDKRDEFDRSDRERKIERLMQNYQELFDDPTIPDAEKERLRAEMEDEIRQLQGGSLPRPPDNNDFCPDFEEPKKKCLANGGRVVQKTDDKGCPFVDCQFGKCTPLHEQPAPHCEPIEVRTDENGCEYYDCGKFQECPDIASMFPKPCADGKSPEIREGRDGCKEFYCPEGNDCPDYSAIDIGPCPNGVAPEWKKDDKGCEVHYCPESKCEEPKQIQCEGNLRKELDNGGCMYFVCDEFECPDISGEEQKCRDSDGVVAHHDDGECLFLDCQYPEFDTGSDKITGNAVRGITGWIIKGW